MATAVPETVGTSPVPPPRGGARPGPRATVPTGTHFGGVPSVGTLYYLGKDQTAHNCTASVVKSPGRDLILTAGHCGPGPNGRTAFVPGYHQNAEPFGIWAVTRGYTLPGHGTTGTGSNLDFAFAVVADRNGRKLEDVTGGNTLTRTPGYANPAVTVIAYPEKSKDPQDQAIRCTVPTTRLGGAGLTQMRVDCRGYWDGVSGGPWMINFNGTTGDIIGNVGGLNGGGLVDPADPLYQQVSYSPFYGDQIFALYKQATTDTSPPPPPPAFSMGDRGTWQHARHVVAGNFTGHGRTQDLITIWSDGEVTLFHGDGNAHFTAETELLAPNPTWTHVVSVTAGPFTAGSTASDLVVRWSDGELTLYTSVGAAGIGGEVQLAAPNATWTHSTVLTGRFGDNGTTSAALVVAWDDGHVSEFPQITAHSLAGEIQMIAANATWTHVRDITAGDLGGNNGYDLLVRWSDGELTLYPDVDATGTHTEIQLAAPNPTWQTLRDFTVGNLTANGRPDDLVTVWADGHVTLYADTGPKGLGTATTLVS
jgi:V8-like Glu-specific endopeptidase